MLIAAIYLCSVTMINTQRQAGLVTAKISTTIVIALFCLFSPCLIKVTLAELGFCPLVSPKKLNKPLFAAQVPNHSSRYIEHRYISMFYIIVSYTFFTINS